MSYFQNHSPVYGASKSIIMGLAYYANADGIAWPSTDTLANHADCGDRMVRKALLDLEQRGLIKRVRRGGTSDRRTNVYRLTAPPCMCPRGASGYINHRVDISPSHLNDVADDEAIP